MSKRLTAQEEIDLAKRIQDNGDEEAFNALVTANMGLVVFVVQKIPSWNLDSCLSRDDMIQEGNLALMRAARTWKPQNRFATYARKLIYSQGAGSGAGETAQAEEGRVQAGAGAGRRAHGAGAGRVQ